MELGDELDAEMPAPGYESTHIKDFTYIRSDRLIIGDEFLRATECFTSQAGNLRALKVVRIFNNYIRTKVTDDFVPPFIIEMAGIL